MQMFWVRVTLSASNRVENSQKVQVPNLQFSPNGPDLKKNHYEAHVTNRNL